MNRRDSSVFAIAAACLVLAGCGRHEAKRPSKTVQRLHHAAAAVLAQEINNRIQQGGDVLLVHRQAAEEIADSWAAGLEDTLDKRFSVTVYGYDQLSEEAALSTHGGEALEEGMRKHPDAVVVVSADSVPPRTFAELAQDGPEMFALAWPFLAPATPLLRHGFLHAGVFERDNPIVSIKAKRGSTPEEIMAPRYLLATADNWKDMLGQ